MPPLSQHQSKDTVKALFIGDSSSGKTGALASLAVAGYKLRIMDFDNGLDVLKNYLIRPESEYYKQNPKAVENVSFVTLQDEMKSVNGRIIPKSAKAWQQAMNLLTHWKAEGEDLGPVVSWTPEHVLVLDSLSFLSVVALNFHLSMNAALGAVRTSNEGRRDVGATQTLLRDLLSMLYDKSIKCHVIVTSHITFVNEYGMAPKAEDTSSISNGYPSAIGRALSPHIPRYFNNMFICRATGVGTAVQRNIYTVPQAIGGQLIGAKSGAPMNLKSQYPIKDGLAQIFAALKG